MPVLRLDRLLANLGYGSRNQVHILLARGLVTVHGEVERNEARKVAAEHLRVDGESLDHPDGVLVLFHKPVDVVCSHERSEGTTVFDVVPERWEWRNPRVESVGRLDKDTSGLLVLTDDHQLLHRLTSPKHHVQKRYEAMLADPCTDEAIERFASGQLQLHGEAKPCLPAFVQVLGEGGRRVAVTMTEGRYHQVRRMFAACGGNHVETLHRTHFGDFALNDLAVGEWVDVKR